MTAPFDTPQSDSGGWPTTPPEGSAAPPPAAPPPGPPSPGSWPVAAPPPAWPAAGSPATTPPAHSSATPPVHQGGEPSAPPSQGSWPDVVAQHLAPPEQQVVATGTKAEDGLSKCARCGATDITLNIPAGALRCNFCRHEWTTPNALETYGLDGDPKFLTGVVVGSGSEDIIPSTEVVMTFKCRACGAEVVIDTDHSMQARCHWCRNTLSVNEQIPNGAVPDMVLPFTVTKEAAISFITDFVGRRKFYAHPKFKEEFNAENVMGVYLPYMVVDFNGRASLRGEGEHLTRTYTVKSGDNQETRYDADLYQVARDFTIAIDDLTVESSEERLDQRTTANTNNIINSIMPFDVENSVTYDSNYLAGFASERRDTNLNELIPIATEQAKDIARYHANSTLGFYDRGVRWDHEQLEMVGQRWVSAYLPVWLYSYYQEKPNGESLCHYVAVNGRTGETMGSIPINRGRLLLISGLVELVGIILFIIFGVVM